MRQIAIDATFHGLQFQAPARERQALALLRKIRFKKLKPVTFT